MASLQSGFIADWGTLNGLRWYWVNLNADPQWTDFFYHLDLSQTCELNVYWALNLEDCRNAIKKLTDCRTVDS